MQARRAGKNKRTAQPSMAEAIKHHAERQAAQSDRMELLRQQREAQRDYQLGREEAPAEEDSDNDSQGVNVHRGLDYGLS
ncbi:hypothetical protein V8C86DRAFT_3089328 [Haematococcus lacustris]